MRHKILLLYTWMVRMVLFVFPDMPCFMRFRGWLYGLGMGKCGRNFQVAHSAILNSLDKIRVGDNVYIANFCSFIPNGLIEVGNNTLFGPGVVVSAGNHKFEKGCFLKQSDSKDVLIGENSWVAANCTIVGGAVLPNGSILAANSVLTNKTNNSKAGCLYGGSPAKLIKEL